MNREIKFRAWDGSKMHHNVCISSNGHAIKPEYRATDWIEQAKGGIPMQYTGLKDKNGVEIYEGDIIGLPWISPFGHIDETYDPEQVYEVVFYKSAFCLRQPHHYSILHNWLNVKEGEYVPNYGNIRVITDDFLGEVLGNRYQNPELLK